MNICPVCKKEVTSGKSYRKELYHPECYQSKLNAARAKDAKKAAIASDPDLIALKSFILQFFELSELSPMLEKQIETLSKKYSYADILYCLHYFFELDNDYREQMHEPSIGIVPYIYREAIEYKARMESAEEANRHFVPSEDQVIVVRPQRNKYKPLTYNISDL